MQTGIVTSGHVFEARPATLSLRSATEALFRQRRLFLGAALMVMFMALAVSALMSRQYVSEMKFLVQNARGNVKSRRSGPIHRMW